MDDEDRYYRNRPEPFHQAYFINHEIRSRLLTLPVFAVPEDTDSKFHHLLGGLAAAESSGQGIEQPATH